MTKRFSAWVAWAAAGAEIDQRSDTARRQAAPAADDTATDGTAPDGRAGDGREGDRREGTPDGSTVYGVVVMDTLPSL
ncbi:MAG TPA: hypothetical protein VFP54_12925 [Acidimicrobiales bacterium]|nr:hypothetical protein [Acidimicrobiales bacterium]